MNRYQINFTWVLESPLHLGSGLSRPGTADRLILRDRNKLPMMSGEAVKGALRMSAEEVLAWQGITHKLPEGGSSPSKRLLQAVFDADGWTSFEPARLKDVDVPPKKDAPPQVRAATAIDPKTGRAMDQTLRTIEVLPRGARFESAVTLRLPASDGSHAVSLLLAALLGTEAIGGKAGIGWGRLRLGALTVTRNGAKADIDDFLTRDALEQLRLEADNVDALKRPVPIGTVQPDTRSDYSWYRLAFTALEPVTVGKRPLVGNEVISRELVPATTLRGALIQAWQFEGENDSAIQARVGPSSRWLPAVLRTGEDPSCRPAIAAPRSWMVKKGKEPFGPEAAETVDALFDSVPQGIWLPLGDHQLRLDQDGKPVDAAAPRRQIRMHMARDYRRRSKLQGALYSHEALEAGTKLVSWVYVPKGTTFPKQIRLGKRRSAGNGLLALESEQVDPVRNSEVLIPDGTRKGRAEVFIQLMSDVVALDKDGYPLKSLETSDWERLLNTGTIQEASSVTGRRDTFGWMRPWGLSSTPGLAITAGSTARLIFQDVQDADALRSKAAQAPVMIGERQHEGFGLLAIDPPWLGQETFKLPAVQARETKLPGPRRWPGAESLSTERVQATLAAAEQAARPESGLRITPTQLNTLRQAARDASRPKEVLDLASRLANRPHPRGWENIVERIGGVLQGQELRSSIEETRLFLDAFAQNIRQRNTQNEGRNL